MNKIAFFIVIAFSWLFATAASAQQSPFRSCNWKPMLIECIVTENDTVINDIIVNRGNCESAQQMVAAQNSFRRNAGMPLINMNRSYKFGEVAQIQIGGSANCNKVIEATVQTNKGNWTFTW